MNLNFNYVRNVFLSHADEDSDIAHTIASNLKRHLNIEVYLDKYFMIPGDEWQSTISKKIQESEILIVLESRIVASRLAGGVIEEIEIAKENSVLPVYGMIRNRVEIRHNEINHVIDFGKNGDNKEAIFDVAKLLLSRTHPFMKIGLAALVLSKEQSSRVHGSTKYIAENAEEVYVIGHTLKSWLYDYGNHIRYGKAKVRAYFPSSSGVGIEYLSTIHRNGIRIKDEIRNSKQKAMDLNTESGFDKDRFECYTIPIKPMFSLMAVDIHKPSGFFTVDNYMIKISSEDRPKMIIYRSNSSLYDSYEKILKMLIQDATLLTSIDQ